MGRQRQRQIVKGLSTKTHGHHVPREEWDVFLPNNHEGYISLSLFESNQRQLKENTNMRGKTVLTTARKGRALLAGLFRCRRCGRKLHIAYSGTDGNLPRYHCRGANVNHGKLNCISFGGLSVDRWVEEAILQVINSESIIAALQTEKGRQSEQNDKYRST